MLRGKKRSSDMYSENLLPTRVIIARKQGNLTYYFEIDGFKGEKTGQIHYKGSEVARIEKFLSTKNPISSFTADNIGLVLYLETPFAVASESKPTSFLAGLEDVFKLQTQAQTRLSQHVPSS